MNPIIENVSDALLISEECSKIPNIDLYYRGQHNNSWELLPKAYRIDADLENDDSYQNLLFNWYRHASVIINLENMSELNVMAIAQHHGLPTRLLDWSTNILVALFFACQGNDTIDGELIVFRPSKEYLGEQDIEDIPFGTMLFGFNPKPFNERIRAQSGVFTYHPHKWLIPKEDPTITSFNFKECLSFTVPGKVKSSLLSRLSFLNINYKTLFPDLDGLSKHLSFILKNERL